MSQRLWENPDYKDETLEKLLAKLNKCIRHRRWMEAVMVCRFLIEEFETIKSSDPSQKHLCK